jgi:hypothetical protein
MKRVYALYRVSTDAQAEDNDIPTQKKIEWNISAKQFVEGI